jgi:DNA-nicking Smr family endonuclease
VRRTSGPGTERRPTENERREFEEDFRLNRPIKPRAMPRIDRKPGGSGGLDGNTQDRLDRGLITPDATLDLHGMTQVAAHRALGNYLRGARERGNRLIVVVTGKGNPRAPDAAEWTQSPHGVLKDMVPRWLAEPGMSQWIARVQAAHIRHGGGGALYVYLRKSR